MALVQVYESNNPKQKRRNRYTSSERGEGGGDMLAYKVMKNCDKT